METARCRQGGQGGQGGQDRLSSGRRRVRGHGDRHVLGRHRSHASRAAATGGSFDEVLVKQLAEGPRQEILENAERFDELHDALCRWDVWAAAYLIGSGCSDDTFTDLRAGVIALGCQSYQRVAADPDSLAAHPDVVQAANVRDRSEVLFHET
ncbi:DUF4240 domain-containing protein [Streptomyces europaeiscabiei]|uniref:DUF4240 domain-containing protein n=1 Tax=Streptomyces europaeiscabiei TaxID=146819 RepID=UPI002E1A0024